MTPIPRLPYHRLPADAQVRRVLVVDQHVLGKGQCVQEELETVAYLEAYLQLVDPHEANDLRTQVFRSRGSHN
jgi:hypothetical protein